MGAGRGSLPTVRVALPDVGSPRGFRPDSAAPPDPPWRWVLRCSPLARWSLCLSPGSGPVQWSNVLLFPSAVAPRRGPNRSPDRGDHRQLHLSPCPTPQTLARPLPGRFPARLPAPVQPGP